VATLYQQIQGLAIELAIFVVVACQQKHTSNSTFHRPLGQTKLVVSRIFGLERISSQADVPYRMGWNNEMALMFFTNRLLVDGSNILVLQENSLEKLLPGGFLVLAAVYPNIIIRSMYLAIFIERFRGPELYSDDLKVGEIFETIGKAAKYGLGG
jgi:hypothetical protein